MARKVKKKRGGKRTTGAVPLHAAGVNGSALAEVVAPVEERPEPPPPPRRRGPQKSPTKQLVSLRLDPDVVEAYRDSGPGWQARMNDTLKAHPPRRARRPRG